MRRMPSPGRVAPTAEEAGAFYDAMWQRYAHLDAASPAAFHRRRLVVDLAARAAPRARHVLDAGCGQGELLAELAARLSAAQIAGADVSARSVADSRAKSPGTDLFVLDLAAADFEAQQRERLGRYDLVVCSEVLEHIADDEAAAARLVRLLAPGGHLVATVPGGAMSRFDVAIGHHRHYDTARLARLLETAGLRVERVLAWGFPFHSLYRTAVRIASRAAEARAGREGDRDSAVPGALGAAYSLLGRALKPLFYLNADRWGEQLIALASKPR